ncbi:MAG: hypothetical protein ACMXX9_02265 [Candidatus Woesearchaeota archaeon]
MIAQDKKIPFYISISFLLSFIAIRLAVLIAGSAESEFAAAAKAGGLPEAQFYIGSNIILFGYHIHHFYFGILLIAIAGWLAIVKSSSLSNKAIAIIYGVGLGLFLDEIGLLLTWGDYYSSLSYTISIFVFAIFLNILFFADFWKTFKDQVRSKSLVARTLNKKNSFLFKFDFFIQKKFKKERLSQLLTAILYIGVAVVLFFYPAILHYYVAVLLILQGFKYILTNQTGDLQHEI